MHGEADHTKVAFLPARSEHAAALASLSGQLGYPLTEEAARQNLALIQSGPRGEVFVARSSEGRVVGWVHVFLRPLLQTGLGAEVGGLVVDAGQRGRDIGKHLIAHAEAWARSRNASLIRVRSREARRQAHAFYEKIGYRFVKRSFTFEKVLLEEMA